MKPSVYCLDAMPTGSVTCKKLMNNSVRKLNVCVCVCVYIYIYIYMK